jgi:MFS transporter, DHA1 family, multidrug resistance protein
MQTHKPSFFTLLLMISFASVNAVLFTPALPSIATFFGVTAETAGATMTWFLIGYTLGQLIYGPLANRFGRKPALYAGISLQIISSLLCVLAGWVAWYPLLILGRFLLALGSGVGLKMTYTLVNECYAPKQASQKMSYLMLAFAITPSLSVALGGWLTTNDGWMSCFYALAAYGFMLLLLVSRLPETKTELDSHALELKHMVQGYRLPFTNFKLLLGGLLMGCCTAFVYVFAAVAPFIAITLANMSSSDYGLANLLPPLGLVIGSLVSARLATIYSLSSIIRAGILIAGGGVLIMMAAMVGNMGPLVSLFLPMIIIYFGLCFIMANASILAMSQVSDKAHGSAVMNFINMGFATVAVLSVGLFAMQSILLPSLFLVMSLMMWLVFQLGQFNHDINASDQPRK